MTINKNLRGISVDAGMMIISDGNYLEDLGGKINKRLAKFIKVESGLYHVEWRIANSWNGDISGSGDIQVKSGNIFVGDPCYHFHNHPHEFWIELLETNNYFRDGSKGHLIVETGGGGGFNMSISVTLLDAAPPAPIKKTKKAKNINPQTIRQID